MLKYFCIYNHEQPLVHIRAVTEDIITQICQNMSGNNTEQFCSKIGLIRFFFTYNLAELYFKLIPINNVFSPYVFTTEYSR